MPTVPSQGWGVLHAFFHVHRAALQDPDGAVGDLVRRVEAFTADGTHQVLCFRVLGQKADFGLMLLGPDLEVLDGFLADLAASPLGEGLAPAGSYVSLTELSEYTSTVEDERARLLGDGGMAEGSVELDAALGAFEERQAAYREHRLHPRLPQRALLCFYPMSKRRTGDDNWYALPFEDRKRLMGGHARVGQTYRGRILQLITTSTGLDDWEWGVTLLADDPKAINDVVYEMRFDEVSARYAEFGPFVLGLVCSPEELGRRLRLTA